jgi:nucleotide-binding universal stress UspA family protein
MLKALIATDGSATSEAALDMAGELLGGKQVEVTLLHVVPRHLIYDSRGGPVVAETFDMAEAQRASAALLDTSAQRLRDRGVGPTITKQLETGDPADVILTVAENHDIDLIIMGSRGLGAMARFLRGSTSTKVSAHAPCAVLVVHPKDGAARGEAQTDLEATITPQG